MIAFASLLHAVTEQELLDRVLAFWQRVALEGGPSEELRRELVELLFAYKAQGLLEGAALLRKARRKYGREDIDAVSRYIMAQVEEELGRRALGAPARNDPDDWPGGESPAN